MFIGNKHIPTKYYWIISETWKSTFLNSVMLIQQKKNATWKLKLSGIIIIKTIVIIGQEELLPSLSYHGS